MSNSSLLEMTAAFDCMHCGLCLESCPTYRATGQETQSPRGRIALVRALAEERLDYADVLPSLNACLLCRACEPACPSRVDYHTLVDEFRQAKPAKLLSWMKPAFFALLRFLRRCGVLSLAERIGTPTSRALAASVPSQPTLFPTHFTPPSPQLPQRGTVLLHLGCVQKSFFGDSLKSTANLLAAQGFQVEIPAQPFCCGSSHSHFGEPEKGNQMRTETVAALSQSADAIISLAAGCSAHLQEQSSIPVLDPLLFLNQQGWRTPPVTKKLRAVWDPPCQLDHVLNQAGAMRRALQECTHLQILEPEDAELCCGAGGMSYALAPEVSDAVTQDKIEKILRHKPDVVLSTNPPCRMRLETGLRKAGFKGEILHPVELLTVFSQP
ncbi:MAG: (Fe-S)-binding protein [Planctomycetota bacterium]|nr:(Fe-S)-binding protein [Planctomycetota bacterium]